MKHYMLSVITPAGGAIPPPEVLEPIMHNVNAVTQEAREAGAWVFAGGLNHPTTATVVRVRDGESLMTDGPFAEGKEYIGGFTIVKVDDLDAALEWGRKYAEAITLPIEVRPFSEITER